MDRSPRKNGFVRAWVATGALLLPACSDVSPPETEAPLRPVAVTSQQPGDGQSLDVHNGTSMRSDAETPQVIKASHLFAPPPVPQPDADLSPGNSAGPLNSEPAAVPGLNSVPRRLPAADSQAFAPLDSLDEHDELGSRVPDDSRTGADTLPHPPLADAEYGAAHSIFDPWVMRRLPSVESMDAATVQSFPPWPVLEPASSALPLEPARELAHESLHESLHASRQDGLLLPDVDSLPLDPPCELAVEQPVSEELPTSPQLAPTQPALEGPALTGPYQSEQGQSEQRQPEQFQPEPFQPDARSVQPESSPSVARQTVPGPWYVPDQPSPPAVVDVTDEETADSFGFLDQPASNPSLFASESSDPASSNSVSPNLVSPNLASPELAASDSAMRRLPDVEAPLAGDRFAPPTDSDWQTALGSVPVEPAPVGPELAESVTEDAAVREAPALEAPQFDAPQFEAPQRERTDGPESRPGLPVPEFRSEFPTIAQQTNEPTVEAPVASAELGTWNPVSVPVASPSHTAQVTAPSDANYDVVARRVFALSHKAEDLASRGAYYAARAEMIKALRAITQAVDSQCGTKHHSNALAQAIRAFEEAGDFAPRGSQLEADLNLAQLVSGHRTAVLKDVNVDHLTPLAVQQKYLEYAQQQLAESCEGLPVGSFALYGLARVYTVMDYAKLETQTLCLPKAMALHQAALLVDARNVKAANELGVLLARFGQLQDARRVLGHALSIQPQPEIWMNMATVHQQLGEADLARQAHQHGVSMASRQTGTRRDGSAAIKWVDPRTFSQARPGPGQ